MRDDGLNAKSLRRRCYSSYLGEISTAAENIVNRDFTADKPNQKWLTDISEFAIASGKLYLSIIRDCYNDEIISWKIGRRASARLANATLENAIRKANSRSTIIHLDRGCHYRWPEWIKITEKNGLIRSMSKKGNSPDNAGCEGVFGRIKNECFYNHDFKGYSLEKFKNYLDKYIHWYNNERIKLNLGGMSPVQYRLSHS